MTGFFIKKKRKFRYRDNHRPEEVSHVTKALLPNTEAKRSKEGFFPSAIREEMSTG
jgi:hypothetical protein